MTGRQKISKSTTPSRAVYSNLRTSEIKQNVSDMVLPVEMNLAVSTLLPDRRVATRCSAD